MSRERNNRFPSLIALLIITVAGTFHSCSDPYDKLLGRWVQSDQYAIAEELSSPMLKAENEFTYWQFEPDTLDMDGVRVAYRIVEDELVMDPRQDTVVFRIQLVSSDRLFVQTNPVGKRSRKLYYFER